MKKTVFTIFAFLIALSFYGQNISASFERNNDGFYTYASGDLEVGFDNSSSEAIVGEKSIEVIVLNDGSGNLQFLFKKFFVTPGDKFEVKFQIKANQNRTVRGKSQYKLENGKAKVKIETPKIHVTNEWQTVEFTVVVPADFDGVAPELLNVGFIEMKLSDSNGLNYYVDDFKIKKI